MNFSLLTVFIVALCTALSLSASLHHQRKMPEDVQSPQERDLWYRSYYSHYYPYYYHYDGESKRSLQGEKFSGKRNLDADQGSHEKRKMWYSGHSYSYPYYHYDADQGSHEKRKMWYSGHSYSHPYYHYGYSH